MEWEISQKSVPEGRNEAMMGREPRMRSFTPAGKHLLFPSLLFGLLLLVQAVSAQEQDTDGDGLPDVWENGSGLDPEDPGDADLDPDQDGLDNKEEYGNSTDPQDPDTDDDGMPDGWEANYGLDPRNSSDASEDADGDGLTNLREYQQGWDPTNDHSPPESPIDDDDGPAVPEGNDAGAAYPILFMLVFFISGVTIVVFIVIAFYTKIKKDRLLDHETRQRIMDHIRDHPGTYYSEIRKDLGLAHGVLTHHLNMLETQEMIFSKQDRQFRRFYAEGMHSNGPIVTGSQKLVLEAIRRNPGLSQSEIGRMLGVSRMVVSYHVSSLERLGLVEGVKEGRESHLYPASPEVEDRSGHPSGNIPLDDEGQMMNEAMGRGPKR